MHKKNEGSCRTVRENKLNNGKRVNKHTTKLE
jgi:hypothetical protein